MDSKDFTEMYDNNEKFTKISDNIYIHKKCGRVKYNYYCPDNISDKERIILKKLSLRYIGYLDKPQYSYTLFLNKEVDDIVDNLLSAYCEKYTPDQYIKMLYNIDKLDFLTNFEEYKNYKLRECVLRNIPIYVISKEKYGHNSNVLVADLEKILDEFKYELQTEVNGDG